MNIPKPVILEGEFETDTTQWGGGKRRFALSRPLETTFWYNGGTQEWRAYVGTPFEEGKGRDVLSWGDGATPEAALEDAKLALMWRHDPAVLLLSCLREVTP